MPEDNGRKQNMTINHEIHVFDRCAIAAGRCIPIIPHCLAGIPVLSLLCCCIRMSEKAGNNIGVFNIRGPVFVG